MDKAHSHDVLTPRWRPVASWAGGPAWLVGIGLLLPGGLLWGCGDDDGGADADAQVVADGPADLAPAAGGGDAGATPGEDSEFARASLADGELRGQVVGDAVRFAKIPYAAPPMGVLRYRAPEPNAAWEGVRAETELPPACPQSASMQTPESLEEDCLYLNVWRPNRAVQDAPVMVWIHGGAHRSGSTADLIPGSARLWYDGQVFAERHGIVVVTLNYRLGPLGFFSHPALADDGSALGNQGLLDQQRALVWVRDNIDAFGGDPDNVTIFGESAGAADVCLHVASPLSRGLFHRAVSQSGGCTGRPPIDPAIIEAGLNDYVEALACDGDDVLGCLRDKPVADLLAAANQMDLTMIGLGGSVPVFGPTTDGPDGFMPRRADEAFAAGDVADVPYILGSNTEEGTLFFLGQDEWPEDEAAYLAELEARWGEFAPRIAELYPAAAFDGAYDRALMRAFGDSFLVCGTHDSAMRASEAGLQVYMYNFNIPWMQRQAIGATHASEISHVFGRAHNDTEESQAVADAMNAYWAHLAKAGDPNHEGAPLTWPVFDPDAEDGDQRIQFDPDWQILTGFRNAECALWAEYNAR